MKGFKATDKDGKCRGELVEVGKTYKTDSLAICKSGYHFCANLLDVYNYYSKEGSTRIFEVEALGKVVTENDKSATDNLKVIRELPTKEILDAVLTRGNSGNRNSGDWNSGNRNSGNRNSGDGNSGYGNSGNRNSGDWNSGDGNSGYFNTEIPVYFFNKPSNIKYTKELEARIRSINVNSLLTWVYANEMTDEEKKNNPSYKITGGYLRKTDKRDWTKLTKDDKEFIKSLPNFDDSVFQKISGGVSLLEPTEIEVTHNGQTFKINLEKAKELGIIK